jgi:hypothetical protein
MSANSSNFISADAKENPIQKLQAKIHQQQQRASILSTGRQTLSEMPRNNLNLN